MWNVPMPFECSTRTTTSLPESSQCSSWNVMSCARDRKSRHRGTPCLNPHLHLRLLPAAFALRGRPLLEAGMPREWLQPERLRGARTLQGDDLEKLYRVYRERSRQSQGYGAEIRCLCQLQAARNHQERASYDQSRTREWAPKRSAWRVADQSGNSPENLE